MLGILFLLFGYFPIINIHRRWHIYHHFSLINLLVILSAKFPPHLYYFFFCNARVSAAHCKKGVMVKPIWYV